MTLPSDTDPVLRSSRREGIVVAMLWLVAMSYTVGYAWMYGYSQPVETARAIYGIPHWVFWGILVPWIACWLFTAWFTFGFMTDDSLGVEAATDDGDGADGEFDDA